jgi:hypothetical protein
VSNITYTRQFFTWQDYIDFVDSVQAGGTNGINSRMHSIEKEFDNLSGVVGLINAGLFFQAVGTPVATGVAYTGGLTVGIGTTFSSAQPPTYSLEVNLLDNTSPKNQVRFGNAVCCNGNTGAFSGYAVFAHRNHAFDSDYAMRQGPNGDVHLNAAAGQPLTFRQSGNTVRFGISPGGNVIIGGQAELPGGGTAPLQVAGDVFSFTGKFLGPPSDMRVKEDVRELEVGLTQLRCVRPVRFRYNGRAGTTAGQESIGVIAQEAEKAIPEMIRRVPGSVGGELDMEDLRIYDGSALTFILVNAVKELAEKVEQLEQALAEARKERGPTGQRAKPR